MSKELEALERIGKLEVNGLRAKPTKTFVNDYNDYHIVETALKEYEEYKSRKNNILPIDKFIGDLGEHTRDEVAMKLKALEIIKEKRVNVQALFYSSSCEDYNKHYNHYEDLTQEEYDLLKEVLKDENF